MLGYARCIVKLTIWLETLMTRDGWTEPHLPSFVDPLADDLSSAVARCLGCRSDALQIRALALLRALPAAEARGALALFDAVQAETEEDTVRRVARVQP